MVLARLLTPAEVGVYSVTVVLMSFATSFRDFGAGQYLVQERELNTERIQAVWTLQLAIGVLLCLLALGASAVMPAFYREPRMREVLWVLALSYVINPFGSLTYAWLMREMRFELLTVMRLSGTLAGAAVSIGLAWRGLGPISLAWGTLTSVATNAAVSMAFRPGSFPWLPGFGELRRVLQFGVRMTSSSIIDSVAQGAPELVLGKLQDMTSVGLLSRANGLVTMFLRLIMASVASVALPMFAKESRETGSIAHSFIRANSYTTVLAWAFCVNVALLAHPLIRTLYGSQWDDSVEVTRWFALVIALNAPSGLSYQALVATGNAGLVLRAVTTYSALTVTGAAIGAFFGLVPLAWGLAAGTALGTASWLRITHKAVGIRWPEYLSGMARSGKVALSSAVLPALLVGWVGLTPPQSLWVVALGAAGGAIGLVAGAVVFKHPIGAELSRLLPSRRRRS